MKKIVGILSVVGMAMAGVGFTFGNDSSHLQDCQVQILEDGSEFVHCNDGSSKLIAMGTRR